MLIQSIPFFAILFILILNILIKKKFFCISTLSLLYVALSFGGAVFLHLRPRTGVPFVDLEAMLFLTLCMSLLCMPALAFHDHTSTPLLKPTEGDMRKLSKLLIIFVLPASLFYLFRAIPYLHQYLTSGMGREEFRKTLEFTVPSESAFLFILQFFACLDFVALFLMVYYLTVVSDKKRKLLIVCLLLCGLGICFDSLKSVSRQDLFYRLCFLGAAFLILNRFVPEAQQKRNRKIIYLIGGCLLVPFFLISVARFKTDFWYNIGSYISTGPYSFNVDYVAVTEYDVPTLSGYLTHGLFSFFSDILFGTTLYTDGAECLENLNKPTAETYWVYRSISGAYSGEFKTAIGSFLIDHSALYAFCLTLLISLSFTLLFLKYGKTQKISVNLLAVVYFYILINSPIGTVFYVKPGNLQLIYLLLFAFVLHCMEKKQMLSPPIEKLDFSPQVSGKS